MTQPQQGNESSVLFSLKELMGLEEDRLRAEERAREETAARVRAATAAAVEAAMAEASARSAAEAAANAERARRDREDQARLVAIHAAEIERERITAERRAQMEVIAQQQTHERELARIEEDAAAKKLRRWLFGVSTAAVLVVGGGLGLYFGVMKPSIDRQAQIDAEHVRVEQDNAARARADADAAKAKIGVLVRERDAATTQAERDKADAEIKRLQDDAKKPVPTAGRPRDPSAKLPPTTATEVCAVGDPLCVGRR